VWVATTAAVVVAGRGVAEHPRREASELDRIGGDLPGDTGPWGPTGRTNGAPGLASLPGRPRSFAAARLGYQERGPPSAGVLRGRPYTHGVNQRGLGLVEILVVLVVIAAAGYAIWHYAAGTARTFERLQEERPLAGSRLAADQATLATLHGLVQAYRAQRGEWPPDKAAVAGLLARPPRFQCPGNDFQYDPASGDLRLAVSDPGRC
jgi:hypothetical protein